MIARARAALRRNPALAAILLLGLGLNLLGNTWGLPNTESWMADSVAGELSLKVWATYTISSHKYPYLQWWINFLAYTPLLAWWLWTGQLDGGCWPYFKAKCFETDAFVQLGSLILISRTISALMSAGTVWLTWRLAREAGLSRRAALLAALALALSHVAVLYAHLGTLDAPVAFWYTLSLLAFLRILARGAARDYAFFGLASGAALGTKGGIIGAYVLTALAILWSHGLGLRRLPPGATARPLRPALLRHILDRRLQALLAGLALVYALSTNLVFNWAGFVEQWSQWLPSESRMQSFQAQRSLVEVTLRAARLLVSAMDLPLLLLALAGLGLALRSALQARKPGAPDSRSGPPPILALFIPGISYLLFSIYLSRVVEMRLLLPLVPTLALMAGLAADRLLDLPGRWRKVAPLLLAAVYLHAGLHSLNHDLLLLRDTRYAAEAWLRAEAGPDTRILAFGDRRYHPRLAWLGLESRYSDPDRPPAPQLAEQAPELVLLSSRWYDRFAGQPETDFYTDLLAGRLGYSPVFESTPDLPLRFTMDPLRASTTIAPHITILRRTP